MASSSKIIVGYWNIRAFIAPIQYLLKLSGLEHEVKLYEFKGDFPNPQILDNWLADKNSLGLDFPNLPYLIDGDVRLTQSMAIMKYIARKAGLLGVPNNASIEELAKLEMIEQQVHDLRMNYFFYGLGVPIIELRYPEGFAASTVRQLEPMAKWMQDKFFLMGDNICYIDCILFETIDIFKMLNPDCLAPYPGLQAYMDRIQNLPGLKSFLESSERILWPVLGPPARNWGFKKEQ